MICAPCSRVLMSWSEGDWGRENYYVAKFGDRFDRAAEETRAAIDAVEGSELADHNREFVGTHPSSARAISPAFKDWRPNQFTSRGAASGT